LSESAKANSSSQAARQSKFSEPLPQPTTANNPDILETDSLPDHFVDYSQIITIEPGKMGRRPISANLMIDASGVGVEVSNGAIEVAALGIRLQQIEVGLEGNTFVLIHGSVAELNAKNGLMAIVHYLRQRRGSYRQHWEQS
jgi:hypothetical protein